MGEALKKLNLDNPLFITSPLKRARETAEIAATAVSGTPPTLEADYVDLNFGRWQGKSKEDVAKLYPTVYEQWLMEPENVIFPDGESLLIVAKRAEAAFVGVAEKYGTRNIIIVSHRVVNKVLLCRLLGAGLNSFWKIIQDTACLNRIQYDGSTFTVRTMNDTCYLHHLKQEDARDF